MYTIDSSCVYDVKVVSVKWSNERTVCIVRMPLKIRMSSGSSLKLISFNLFFISLHVYPLLFGLVYSFNYEYDYKAVWSNLQWIWSGSEPERAAQTRYDNNNMRYDRSPSQWKLALMQSYKSLTKTYKLNA